MSLLCRLCNESIYNLNAINIFEEVDNAILTKIKTITGIWLFDTLNMPKHICACCHLDLNHSIAFRERCIKTHKIFLAGKKTLSENGPFKITLVDDPLNTVKPKPVAESVRTNRKQVVSDGEFGAPSPLAPDPMIPKSNISKLTQRVLVRLPKPAASAQPNPPTSESRIIQAAPGKRKRSLLAQTLVCDQCGKCFKDASNLKLHLVRHTGVKDFQCSQCGEKYFTNHLLNLHVRVRHKGEKPYKCKFCGLRFFTSTARCRHERVEHIRTRCFKCKYCGKGFVLQSCLKKHEFLHSGERPYRCEVCGVGFPRNTNLKLHFRSKTHQKMASQVSNSLSDDTDQIESIMEGQIDFNEETLDEFDDN